MVSKKIKSKIFGFMPHIQVVMWDFFPSSTLAIKVVSIRNLEIWSKEKRPLIFKKFYSDKKSHGTP